MKILPLMLLLIVILACSQSQQSTKPTATPAKVEQRTLRAAVELTPRGVKISNTDTVDFTSVNAEFNMNQWGRNDGETSGGPVPQGKSVTIPYETFTVGTTRFNIRKTKILTVYVKDPTAGSKLFLCPGSRCVEAPAK